MSEWTRTDSTELPEVLTPQGYGIWLAETAASIGLPMADHGSIVCEDDEGGRWTFAGEDTAYIELIDASVKAGNEDGPVELSGERFPLVRKGWKGVDW